VGDPEARTEAGRDGTSDVDVVVGRGPQAVVDVNSSDVASRCNRECDQRRGISAPRKATRDDGARRRKCAPQEEVGGLVQRNASVGDP